MSRRSSFTDDILSRQATMLRLAERDCDLTLKRLEVETGIPKETLATYKRGVAMPAWVMVALCAIIPDELTSLMMEPAGKHIGTDESEPGDLDALGREAAEFTSQFVRAKASGDNVSPIAMAGLRDMARRLAPKARAVAA